MATRNKRLPDSHFRRHEGVPGFIYIARNEFHEKDLFKVGYTSRESAQIRINSLNQGLKRGGAGALGFLRLVYDRKTLNSYGAEQIAHSALKIYRVTNSREYFRAPLHDIKAAVDMAVKNADEARQKELDRLQAMAEMQAMQEENARRLDVERRSAEAEAAARKKQVFARVREAQLEAQNQKSSSTAPGTTTLNTPARNQSIDVLCVNCQKQLEIDSKYSGLSVRIRCPVCQHVFMLNEPAPHLPPRPLELTSQVKASPRPDTLVPDGGRTGRYVSQGTGINADKTQVAFKVAFGALAILALGTIAPYFVSQPIQAVPTASSTTTSEPIAKAFTPSSPTAPTVEAVAAQALVNYPYLITSHGDKPSRLIVAERDRRIARGVPPPMALNQAVELIAPKYSPKK